VFSYFSQFYAICFSLTQHYETMLSPLYNYPSIQPRVKLIALVVQEATHLNNLLPWIESINHLVARKRADLIFVSKRRCMLLG
jgi:hypothetical protein